MNIKTLAVAAVATVIIAAGANTIAVGFSDARDNGRCNDKDYYATNSRWCDVASTVADTVRRKKPRRHHIDYHPDSAYASIGAPRQQVTVMRDTQAGGDEVGAGSFIATQTAANVAAGGGVVPTQVGWLPSAEFYAAHPNVTVVATHRASAARPRVASVPTQNVNVRISLIPPR